jgi:hypothetical protein
VAAADAGFQARPNGEDVEPARKRLRDAGAVIERELGQKHALLRRHGGRVCVDAAAKAGEAAGVAA